MAKQSSQLSWCVVRMGNDMNWWVHETSDPIHWDTDGLAIIDPRQMSYLVDLAEPLREYNFDIDLFDDAFYSFRPEKEVGKGLIRLSRIRDSILNTEEALFALPDFLDEDKSPYAELLNELIKARVKLLNDSIEFDHPLTVDEVEEALSERSNNDYAEGRALHVFIEILTILEYVPDGFEDEIDETPAARSSTKESDSTIDDIPDIDEEDIEEDETMQWGDEDEDEDSDGDEDEEEEDEDDAPKSKKATSKAAKAIKKVVKKSTKATKKKN